MKSNVYDYWSEFTELVQKKDTTKYPEFFFYYCRHVPNRELYDKYVRNARYLFELAKRPVKGCKILDVGCGFGIDSVIFAADGAESVHGIDVNPDWIDCIHKYMKELKWDLPIYTKPGDASHLDFDDNSFDVVLSVEAISHYHDPDTFLREAHRVLKVGGSLIVSDGNNGANPQVRKKTFEIWDRFENGPIADSFHGHRIEQPFVEMRKEIISESFSELPADDIEFLAKNTFGFGDKDILEAVEKYVADGAKPDSPFKPGEPAFNPRKNDYIEQLFDPRELAGRMEKIGFSAKPYAHFGGAGGDGVVSKANAVLRTFSPLTVLWSPTFKVVAVKK